MHIGEERPRRSNAGTRRAETKQVHEVERAAQADECPPASSSYCHLRRHGLSGGSHRPAGERGNFLLQLRLVGAHQLVHLLPVLQEEERRGRTDVPRRAEFLR